MNKKWRVSEKDASKFASEHNQYHPLIAQLLYNRGLQSQQEVDLFFNPDYQKLHDPCLFKDMGVAVERIWQAIEKQEKILIHGDYDADGVTSASVLFKTLSILQADVEVFIPHRELDGYGLNMENVQKFIDRKIKLLITVDCGITNVKEIDFLNKNKVDVIVTDHHQPLEILPAAIALLDPKVVDAGYPFKELSGAGVAYKLVQALLHDPKIERFESELSEYGGRSGFLKWLLDIVAIGTIADIVPLIDENRILVKWGLTVLGKTKNFGLQKLLNIISNKKIDTYTIGYQLAPRLNAAGRIKHAEAAFELLTTADLGKAEQLADDLQKNNLQRQKLTELAVQEVKSLIDATQDNKIFFAYKKEWEPGIIGLIAGKLADELYRPVIIMTESNGRIVGSGRSIEEFNITNGLVTVSDLLARFGGHSQACGFTLARMELLDDFKSQLTKYANESLKDLTLSPCLDIDAEINFSLTTWDFINQLNQFEPYGEGNEKPKFLLKNLQIVAVDYLGDKEQHIRMMVKQGDNPSLRKLIGFGLTNGWRHLAPGDIIEAVVEIGVNEWNGNRDIECRIIDLKK